jgi:hypothetical protein
MELRKIDFYGFEAIELKTQKARMVVVTSVGPRVAFFGKLGGENLLYWKNDDIGYGEWRLLGGHRVWISRPGADESEDAYAPDNNSCKVVTYSDGIDVSGEILAGSKTQRGLRIRILNESTFQVTSFITNCGPFLYSGGVWAATCINPTGGKQFGILLGDRQLSWDLIKIVIPRKFAVHTSPLNDPQITFTEDFMVINPVGIETKRMVMAPQGIIAMTWPEKGLSFLKRSRYNPHANYPQGCNIAIYNGSNNLMFEMETFGEEQTVLPGDTIENQETWIIVERVYDWNNPSIIEKEFQLKGK